MAARGGKNFICRRVFLDFLSRERVSFCAAGGGRGGQVQKTVLKAQNFLVLLKSNYFFWREENFLFLVSKNRKIQVFV